VNDSVAGGRRLEGIFTRSGVEFLEADGEAPRIGGSGVSTSLLARKGGSGVTTESLFA